MIFLVMLLLWLLAYPAAATTTVSYRPETYGAVVDCIADDTTALLNMQSAILSAQTSTAFFNAAIILGDRKCYKYTSNRWLWGIRNVSVYGNGSSLQNVSNSSGLGEKYVLFSNRDPFMSNARGQPWAARTNAYLINTVSSGSTSVTTTSPSDAGNFSPGQWALVYSRDQQFFGYPPNPRNFDYVRVVSVNTTTGVITLDRPLEKSHSSTEPEISQTIPVGRARIMPIEDTNVAFGESIYVENVTFLNNPNVSGSSYERIQNSNQVYFDGYYNVALNNVNGPTLIISQSKYFTVNNSHWYEVVPDKVVRTLTMNNDIVDDGISEGTGIDTITLSGGYYATSGGPLIRAPIIISPRNLSISNIECDNSNPPLVGYPAINLQGGGPQPISSINITGINCLGSGASNGYLMGNYNSALKWVVGTDATLSGTNQLTANITGTLGSIQQQVVSCLTVGTYAGIIPSGAGPEVAATVSSVVGDGTFTNAIVTVSSSRTMINGDTFVCHYLLNSNISLNGMKLTNFASPSFNAYMPSP